MNEMHQFVKVEFHRFKAFKSFTLHLRHFNILVGPNNAGKSTVLAAFRILAAGLRRANSRNPNWVSGPQGSTRGYNVDIGSISVADENIFFNYDESESASVVFHLSNKNRLILFFPPDGGCNFIPDAQGFPITTTAAFKRHFNCPIGFVPILGPVEHQELLYGRDAAKNALYNYRAARNFRNIWYHMPDRFQEFRENLQQTWPGMDIELPQVEVIDSKSRLIMMCPEKRIPRELFWSGFGFQVWCQMLTHLIQSKDRALFLIDEPDIYLHSDLQRQLISLLRDLGPDILLATHSAEIITEAEADDIILVNKENQHGRRIQDTSQLHDVLKTLGSNLNPILTQLAKTKRVLFVEGQDFQIIGRFARKLGFKELGSQRNFAVVPLQGFNPEKMKNLKLGMETTLGTKITSAIILDRDYRGDAEREFIERECAKYCDHVFIHGCKEIENYLLVPSAIERAFHARAADRRRRSEDKISFAGDIDKILDGFASTKRNYVASQMAVAEKQFSSSRERSHETTVLQKSLDAFTARWSDKVERLKMVGGKEALGHINHTVQNKSGFSITTTAIIEAMYVSEVTTEMKEMIEMLARFSKS